MEDRPDDDHRDERPVLHAVRRGLDHRSRRRCAVYRESRGRDGAGAGGGRSLLRAHAALHRERVLMQLSLIVGSLVLGVVVLTGIVGYLIDKSAGEDKDGEAENPAAPPAAERDLKVTKR